MLLRSINWQIFLSAVLLLSVSILVIFSSSKELALQQLIFAFLGILLFIFISATDYKLLVNYVNIAYFVILAMLILVFILGIETRGSLRWIPLGPINIQPSEFAKPVLILFLANFWSNNTPTFKNIAKCLIWIFPMFFLIFKQPDLGTTLTILSIWIGIIFFGKLSIKKILALSAIAILLVPLVWFTLQDYQKQRVASFLSPTSDPLGVGYNLIQSTIAVGSGEFFGRGLGRGTQSRLQFLPEFRTDFIFAAIAEELGFTGSVLIISIYLFLIWYCFKIAEHSNDFLGFLIVCGVAVMLLFQTVVNVGMNIGVLPITGITLPLMSYGGSSLIATMICLGLVSSIAKSRTKKGVN